MSLAFHPDALDEYLAAIRAHDEAGAFVEAVARCVSQAARWPKSGTLEAGYAVEVRRFIVPRFRHRLHVAMLSPPSSSRFPTSGVTPPTGAVASPDHRGSHGIGSRDTATSSK